MQTRQLILFRHGKSDWGASYREDHDRPLAPRGIKAGRIMGRLLAESGRLPDLVISSSAVRARTTVELAAEAGRWPCPIEISGDLYDTDAGAVLSVIRSLPDDKSAVLLAGHEPTTSSLAEALIGGGHLRVPTAAMLKIRFPCAHWSEVVPGSGELVWLLPPRFFAN